MMNNWIRVVWLIVGALVFASCQNGGTSTAAITVSISPSGPLALMVNDESQLSATVANTSNTAVTWISGDTSIATVSSSGLVKAVAAGSTSITARSVADTSKNSSITVNVSAAQVQLATVGETKTAMVSTGSGTIDLVKEFQTEVNSLTQSINAASLPLGNFAGILSVLTPDSGVLSTGKYSPLSLQDLRASLIQAVTETKLQRGEYTCAKNSGCTKTAESDDLVQTQATTQGLLKLVADWDGSSTGTPSATVTTHPITIGNPQLFEYPTKAVVTITLDTKILFSGTLTVSYHPSQCISGTYLLDVPDALQLTATVNHTNSNKAIGIVASLSVTNTQITTTGDISATGVNNQGSVKWNVSSNGTLERGTCGQAQKFAPTDVNFSTETAVNGANLALSFLMDQIAVPGIGNTPNTSKASVRFQNGVLKVNTKQVLFSGILDETNGNCIPGENLNLTFASGTTNLEAFLISQFDARSCPPI